MISTLEDTGSPAIPLGQPFQFMPQCHACPYHKAMGGLRELFGGKAITPPPAPVGISLRDAINEVLVAKRAAGLREISITSLSWYLNDFAKDRDKVLLASIGRSEIESWLTKRNPIPVTRQTIISRLSSLFSYHVRRDNIAANPCDKLEHVKIDRKPPIVLTPAQAAQLLKFTPDKYRPYVILGMFAGIRPDELLKLTWDDVCLETKTVRVNLAKTRRRRIVPLEPCAVALLAMFHPFPIPPAKGGNIAPPDTSIRNFKRRAAEHLGFSQWPHDLLRHTAASYLLALVGEVGKVAARLGNSSAIMLTHYHEPVKKADCEEFWKLSTLPAAPRAKSKYDHAAIVAFYEKCKSYKETAAHFGLSSKGTLHYILSKSRKSQSNCLR